MDSILVTPPLLRLPDGPPPLPADQTELLRQLVDLQRQQLDLFKAQQANQDDRARTRSFHGRHAEEFPDLPAACKRVLPAVERAYLALLADLTERVGDDTAEVLGNEFAVAEFLDRYGMKLMQLGNILGQVGQLANLAPPDAS
jgi:phage gp36-like protein